MATPDEIKIRIIAKDEASKVFRQTKDSSDRLISSVNKLKLALLGISVAGGVFLKSVIDTGAQVQQLRVRLRFLTGSVESGARAFQIMSQYASTVPFALQEIQQGSAQLLTVANDVNELNGLLQITGDLAAVSGLSFVEASSQLQRAFSAGIASADLFRERGVSAFLGFQSGVTYTAAQTRKQIVEAFQNGTTTAVGATKELSKTFIGQVSMMEDAWFNLKVSLADTGLVDEATKQIKALTNVLKDPEVIDGVKTFTKALLDLFQFVTRNAQVLLAIGAVWFGAKLGSEFGGILGKRGKAIGAVTGGLVSLLATLKLLDEETKKTLTDLTVYVDDAGESGANLTNGLNNLSTGASAVTENIEKTKDAIEDYGLTLQEVERNAVKGLEDSFVDLINGTQNVASAFKNMARSIINDLIRMQIQQSITAPLMGMINAGGLNIGTAMKYGTNVGSQQTAMLAAQDFEGGGYTGAGSRSGGLDGKGGFPAMLHPNETVIDHTKGQGMSAPVNVTLNISTGVAQTVRTEIASLMPQITAATKQAVVDARRRGGSFANAFGG